MILGSDTDPETGHGSVLPCDRSCSSRCCVNQAEIAQKKILTVHGF